MPTTTASSTLERRRVLWAVLAINAVMFLGEFSAAVWADAAALLADSAHNLGDVLTYAITPLPTVRFADARH